jgi:hypothetical protein
MAATPVGSLGTADRRIAPLPAGATVTISWRPEGSSVDTVSLTPSPSAPPLSTSRAEYSVPDSVSEKQVAGVLDLRVNVDGSSTPTRNDSGAYSGSFARFAGAGNLRQHAPAVPSV